MSGKNTKSRIKKSIRINVSEYMKSRNRNIVSDQEKRTSSQHISKNKTVNSTLSVNCFQASETFSSVNLVSIKQEEIETEREDYNHSTPSDSSCQNFSETSNEDIPLNIKKRSKELQSANSNINSKTYGNLKLPTKTISSTFVERNVSKHAKYNEAHSNPIKLQAESLSKAPNNSKDIFVYDLTTDVNENSEVNHPDKRRLVKRKNETDCDSSLTGSCSPNSSNDEIAFICEVRKPDKKSNGNKSIQREKLKNAESSKFDDYRHLKAFKTIQLKKSSRKPILNKLEKDTSLLQKTKKSRSALKCPIVSPTKLDSVQILQNKHETAVKRKVIPSKRIASKEKRIGEVNVDKFKNIRATSSPVISEAKTEFKNSPKNCHSENLFNISESETGFPSVGITLIKQKNNAIEFQNNLVILSRDSSEQNKISNSDIELVFDSKENKSAKTVDISDVNDNICQSSEGKSCTIQEKYENLEMRLNSYIGVCFDAAPSWDAVSTETSVKTQESFDLKPSSMNFSSKCRQEPSPPSENFQSGRKLYSSPCQIESVTDELACMTLIKQGSKKQYSDNSHDSLNMKSCGTPKNEYTIQEHGADAENVVCCSTISSTNNEDSNTVASVSDINENAKRVSISKMLNESSSNDSDNLPHQSNLSFCTPFNISTPISRSRKVSNNNNLIMCSPIIKQDKIDVNFNNNLDTSKSSYSQICNLTGLEAHKNEDISSTKRIETENFKVINDFQKSIYSETAINNEEANNLDVTGEPPHFKQRDITRLNISQFTVADNYGCIDINDKKKTDVQNAFTSLLQENKRNENLKANQEYISSFEQEFVNSDQTYRPEKNNPEPINLSSDLKIQNKPTKETKCLIDIPFNGSCQIELSPDQFHDFHSELIKREEIDMGVKCNQETSLIDLCKEILSGSSTDEDILRNKQTELQKLQSSIILHLNTDNNSDSFENTLENNSFRTPESPTFRAEAILSLKRKPPDTKINDDFINCVDCDKFAEIEVEDENQFEIYRPEIELHTKISSIVKQGCQNIKNEKIELPKSQKINLQSNKMQRNSVSSISNSIYATDIQPSNIKPYLLCGTETFHSASDDENGNCSYDTARYLQLNNDFDHLDIKECLKYLDFKYFPDNKRESIYGKDREIPNICSENILDMHIDNFSEHKDAVRLPNKMQTVLTTPLLGTVSNMCRNNTQESAPSELLSDVKTVDITTEEGLENFNELLPNSNTQFPVLEQQTEKEYNNINKHIKEETDNLPGNLNIDYAKHNVTVSKRCNVFKDKVGKRDSSALFVESLESSAKLKKIRSHDNRIFGNRQRISPETLSPVQSTAFPSKDDLQKVMNSVESFAESLNSQVSFDTSYALSNKHRTNCNKSTHRANQNIIEDNTQTAKDFSVNPHKRRKRDIGSSTATREESGIDSSNPISSSSQFPKQSLSNLRSFDLAPSKLIKRNIKEEKGKDTNVFKRIKMCDSTCCQTAAVTEQVGSGIISNDPNVLSVSEDEDFFKQVSTYCKKLEK